MKLFREKRDKPSPPASQHTPLPGLPEVAAARGWQAVDGEPIASELDTQVHRLAWILHGREYSTVVYDTTSLMHSTVYRNSYRGEADGHPIAVTNALTDIGPQHVVKLLEMTSIAVCVVEHCKLPPLQIQPRRLPLVEHVVPETPTGDAEFDTQFVTKLPLPGTLELMTDDARRQVSAHDDWAFTAMSGSLLCASTGGFESGDQVAARVDEVMALVATFAAEVLPTSDDPETSALFERVSRITNLDDALAFVLGLTPHERELLARSDTPLAAFAEVTTPEQALAALQSLDMTQRMRLFAMMDLQEEQ